jgi:hypothetical protein
MSDIDRLEAIFATVIQEARRNSTFRAKLEAAIGNLSQQEAPVNARRSNRRGAAVLDPFSVFTEGEGRLRTRLEALDLEQLKDIVAEQSMDPSRLALKWKTPERLIDLIVTTVRDRVQKGDAFRRLG